MKWVVFTVVLAAALLGPLAAMALECGTHIEQTERNLVHVRKLMEEVKEEKRPRIQNFIDDAEKMLRQAKKNCEQAASPFDKSVAIAKALVAQGNLGAAQLLIKAE